MKIKPSNEKGGARVLVVDDEELSRQRIVRILKELDRPVQIEEAGDGLQALQKISEFQPQIVLLDVEMPVLTGFEVLQNLEVRPFKIIFQTAHDEFAIKAFEENACDYLLKPFTAERLEKALHRALTSLPMADSNSVNFGTNFQPKKYLEKIAVRHRAQLHLLNITDVVYFQSKDHCTLVQTLTGEFVCDLSLSRLIERLPPELFWRLHRNNIVKISAIKAVRGGENMKVELTTGEIVPVSRSNRKRLLEMVRQHQS